MTSDQYHRRYISMPNTHLLANISSSKISKNNDSFFVNNLSSTIVDISNAPNCATTSSVSYTSSKTNQYIPFQFRFSKKRSNSYSPPLTKKKKLFSSLHRIPSAQNKNNNSINKKNPTTNKVI
jgi:hypothetical protein